MTQQDRQDPVDESLWRRLANGPPAAGGPCLDASTLAAYLDGSASPAEQARVEAHLAGCERCLDAVVEGRDLLAQAPLLVPQDVLDSARTLVNALAVRTARRPTAALGRVPSRWWRVAQWAAAAAAAVAVSYGGYVAGASTYRHRTAQAAVVVREASFDLADSSALANLPGDDVMGLGEGGP